MNIIIFRGKKYGGITTFTYNLLDQLDHYNEGILFLDKNVDTSIVELVKKQYNLTIKYLPNYNTNTITLRWIHGLYILRYIKNNYENIDKLIFTDWNLILDWIPHLTRINIIVFIHTYPNRNIPFFLKRLVNFVIRNTKLITVSNYSAVNITKKWHVDKEQIEVIHNSSNLDGVTEFKVLDKNSIDIVTIAHCEPYKNPKMWLEIANEITTNNANVKFHWYGEGSLYEKYKKTTENSEQIFFHGYTNEVERILKDETTVYLQCSTIENLSISMVDAMNYSIPLVVSNVGGSPETIIEDINGYVCDTKDEFIEKINSIISNEYKYKSMSIASKVLYNSKFSKEKWNNDIGQIFN